MWAVSSLIEVSWKEWVHYLLQLSALYVVLCRSSTRGLPLNAIRLQLWLFALFNYSRNAFWSVWFHDSPLTLGLRAHTHTHTAAPVCTHKHMRKHAKCTQTQFGKFFFSQHVLINLLRAICQEIFSFKQPSVNRDEALSKGQGTDWAIAVFMHPGVSIRIMRVSFYLFKHTDQSLI